LIIFSCNIVLPMNTHTVAKIWWQVYQFSRHTGPFGSVFLVLILEPRFPPKILVLILFQFATLVHQFLFLFEQAHHLLFDVGILLVLVEEYPGLSHFDESGVWLFGGDGLVQKCFHLFSKFIFPLVFKESFEDRVVLRSGTIWQSELGQEFIVWWEVLTSCVQLFLEFKDINVVIV